MGVPGLFSFLNRRYPQITRPAGQKRDQQRGDHDQADNLYIDMNHIIHSCTHALVAKDRPEVSQADMFAGMAAYLENLLDLLEPRRVVMVAVDGVAPRAKINQQRTRRFLSAYTSDITDRTERDVRREMMSEGGGRLHIPHLKRFDPNIITPGTDFMLALAQWLREWASQKVARDTRFTQTAFIISDAAEPGEGEHKIMKFMRHLRAQPGYNPNTQHVVFGQDADLLLLTLLTHEPFIRIVREDMQGRTPSLQAAKEAEVAKQQQFLLQQQPLSAVHAALIKQQQQQPATISTLPNLDSLHSPQVASSDHLHMPMFEVVDVGLLRECLHWEFCELVGAPGPAGVYGNDLESENDRHSSTDGCKDDSDNTVVPALAADSTESVQLTIVPAAGHSKEAVLPLGHVQSSGEAVAPAAAADAIAVGLVGSEQAAPDKQAAGGAAASGGEQQHVVEGLNAVSDSVSSSDSLEDLLGLAVGGIKGETVSPPPVAGGECAPKTAVDSTGEISEETKGQLSVTEVQQAAVASDRPTLHGGFSLNANVISPALTALLLPPSVTAASTAYNTSVTGNSSSSSSSGLVLQEAIAPGCNGQRPLAVAADGVVVNGKTALRLDIQPATATTETRPAAAGTNKPATTDTTRSRPTSSNIIRSGSPQVLGAVAPKHRGKPGLNFENLLDDLVLLTFMVGNDFLPNIPSIDIYDKPCGLDLLFASYKHLLSELGGHLSGGGVINRSRLVQLLVFLTRDEEPAYKRRADYRRKRARERSAGQAAAAAAEVAALFDGGLSVGELPAGVDVDQLMAGLAPGVADALGLSDTSSQPAVDLSSMTPGQLCEELSNRTAARVKDRIMGGDPWAQDPIQMDMPRYRERYYEARFPGLLQQCEGDVDKVAARVSWEYMQGLDWVFRYYTAGPAAIHWQQQGEQPDGGSGVEAGLENGRDDDPAADSSSSSSDDGETQTAAGEGVGDLEQQGQQSDVVGPTAAAAAAGSEEYDDDNLLMTLLAASDDLMPNKQQQHQQQGVQGNLPPAGASIRNPPGASEQRDLNQQQQQQLSVGGRTRTKGKKHSHGTASGSVTSCEGSSWTWCYPYHYAPLMQDLSKMKLWQKTARHKQSVLVGAVAVSRQLSSPHCCPLSHWAPPGGPIRPLLQLMCVLPAKSVADALPQHLANVVALAENMDDTETAANSSSQQHGSNQRSSHSQQQHRQSGVAAAAATAFSALALAEDDLSHGQAADTNNPDNNSVARDEISSTDSKPTSNHGRSFCDLLGFELTGDRDVDMLKLAQELSASFPADVAPLVDLTGKKWLHTGVVRLPMTDPQRLAAVLQAVLMLQHTGDDPADGLSETELLANSFRPATVITTATASTVIAEPVSSTGSSSSSSSTNVWRLFTVTAAGQLAGHGSSNTTRGSSGGGSAAAAFMPATAAAASLGALGALLGHRGALHTLPTNTLQHLPSFKSRQQQQQSVALWECALDVAGLPVPSHSCHLLTGTHTPELTVTPSVWRRTAAGFTSAINYAEKVLGIRSSSSSSYTRGNDTNNNSGRQGRGRRGDRGGRSYSSGWEGRGPRGGGYVAAGGGRGAGFYSRQAQQQQRQQQPYFDPALYYVRSDSANATY